MRLRGLSAQRSSASRSLTCAASRNLSPPYFTNGMLRRISSSSSRSLWCAARNSTACWRSVDAALALLEHLLDHVVGLRLVVLHRHVGRSCDRLRASRSFLRYCGRAVRHQRVGGVEDRLRRAVVLLERHDARGGVNCCGNSRMLSTVAARNE